MKLRRRPSEDELTDRLRREEQLQFLDEDGLGRLARRTLSEGRKLENIVKRRARRIQQDKQEQKRERLELDRGRDHADPEDALWRPVYMGAPSLGKRRR